MIDREARDRMASALRRLLARQSTNDEFEEQAPSSWRSRDGVLGPVASRAWMLYSDLDTHALEPEVADALRAEVARWVLFLQTDLEYRWPRGPWDDHPIHNWPLNLLTLGWWERRKARLLREWEQCGDVTVWPFLNRAELDVARAEPRFLVGSA